MEGCDIGSVGEFRYLGTTTTRDGIGTREMRKRRVIVATAFQQMENIWRSGSITVSETEIQIVQSSDFDYFVVQL